MPRADATAATNRIGPEVDQVVRIVHEWVFMAGSTRIFADTRERTV